MDTLQSKLYGISTYEYYCPSCSTHYEIDDLTLFKPHHRCPNYKNHAHLKVVREGRSSRFTVLAVLKKMEGSTICGRVLDKDLSWREANRVYLSD